MRSRHIYSRAWRLLTGLLAGALAALCLVPAEALATPLPDSRVYELVSPADKSGGIGGVFPNSALRLVSEGAGLPLQSSVNGAAFAYEGEDFYTPRLGAPTNQYLSLQGPDGWSTQNLSPAGTGISKLVGFSPDLTAGIISSEDQLAEDGLPNGYVDLYLDHTGSLVPLLDVVPPNRSARTFGYSYTEPGASRTERALLFAGGNDGVGAVPPYSHLVFAANDALTPATTTAPAAVDGGPFANNLYEWTDGTLRLVNVLPNGETEPEASFGVDNHDVFGNEPSPSLSHVISADGSKIFWTDENSAGPNDGNLYVREDGERTTLIAAGAQFQTASVDGGRAFFTKAGHLYQYDTRNGTTTDLATGGGVEGLVGVNNEGTFVYFVATSGLTEGAQVGQPNLYLSHETTSGEHTIGLVTTLSEGDDHATEIGGSGGTPNGDWFRTFAGRTAEVSPNGRYVAFLSQKSLTGYDNTVAGGTSCSLQTTNCASEVFLYDSQGGGLACASCNTDGTLPTDSGTLLPRPVTGIYQERYLDDSGRLFFSTGNAVLPEDTNGLSDVYEYENGHVYLISPGSANDEAVFADASESGNDVFFTTRQQLVSADQDQIVDLYDARVNGRPEPGLPPPCQGEVCHEPAVLPPPLPAPLSSEFVGPGNPAVASTAPPPSRATPPTRAQQLARALRACRAMHSKHVRRLCEVRARRRYRVAAGKAAHRRAR